jgi:RNA polymerase sigma-70 factor (ECF subfamily)
VRDGDALLGVLQKHDGSLRRIARAYAGADDEELDLYQEIVVQAMRALPSFRGDAQAGTWLFRVALNTALTWRRKTRRYFSSRTPLESAEGQSALIRSDSTRSQAAILHEFLGTLNGPNHSVLILYMEGLSYQEIAEVTGLKPSAVGVRIYRMKQAFTERYLDL